MAMIYCYECGKKISCDAGVCPSCGAPNKKQKNLSDKNPLIVLLLAIFVGGFGFHRFYVGKIGTGILMLLTFGLLGIWTLIDIIVIVCGNFQDSNGKKLKF